MSARDWFEIILYEVGDAVVTTVPHSLSRRVLTAGARAFVRLKPKYVRWALVNLRIAYPDLGEAELLELARESYAELATNFIEYVRSNHWSDEQVMEHCPLEGFEHVEKALSRGKGLLLLTLHIGNWEIGVQAIAIGLQRFRPAVIGRTMRNPMLYQRLTKSRTRAGAELIDRHRAAQRVLRALRENRPVGVLNDQYSRRSKGVFVPMFGKRCSTSAGMATLALRTGSPVLPCYVLRAGPDRHRGIFGPELEIPLTGDRKQDIEIATTHYNLALEKIIRAHPEQWMWGHRRFRNSPDLPRDLYE